MQRQYSTSITPLSMAALVTAPTLASNVSSPSMRSTAPVRSNKEAFILTLILQQVKTYSTCYSTPCAPCYIAVDPKTLSYPDYIDIANETYTLNVTPRPTTFPNGSVSIAYETEQRIFSTVVTGSVSDLQLEEIYTWVVPGNAGTNLTL